MRVATLVLSFVLIDILASPQQVASEIFHEHCIDIGVGNVRTGEKYCRICITVLDNGTIRYTALCGRQLGENGPLMSFGCSHSNTYYATFSPQEDFYFDVLETKVSYDFTLAPNDEITTLWQTTGNTAFTFDRTIVNHLIDKIQRSRGGAMFWSVENGPWPKSKPWKSIRYGADARVSINQWLRLCAVL